MLNRLLHNHVLANLAFALVLVLGAFAFASMPREQDPEINFNWIDITTVLPGAVATELLSRARSYDGEATGVLSKLMLRHGVPPRRVAKRVVRAIRRNEAEVLIGWDARVLTTAATLSPTLVRHGLASAFRHRRRSTST